MMRFTVVLGLFYVLLTEPVNSQYG